MADANTDFGRVADDLRRAASSFALLTSSATAFGAALNEFRQFERQLRLTNAIAGGTVQQFEAMSTAAREFSLVTTISATEAGTALQQLAQAGFTAQESLDAMTGVLLLAQATMTDVAVTSDIIASNIRAFGLEASDTTRVANLFTAAVTSSLATMDKLSFAFRQVAPVANIANLSIEETTALLNQLFNVGLRGEQAGTALRNIIIRLVRPLGEAQDILRKYSIATTDATGALLPLVDIFRQLRESGVTTAELARIFETEALAGVITLLEATKESADGLGSAYSRNLEQISGTSKALEVAVENLDTLDGSLKLLSNTVADVQKSIGGALAPTIRQLADVIIGAVAFFKTLDESTQQLIITTAGIVTVVGLAAASINALALLLGGVGGRAVIGFIRSILLLTKNLLTLRLFTEAAAKGAALFTAAATGLPSVIGGISGAIRTLGTVISFLIPGGILVRGILAITAALAVGAGAWFKWGNAAEDAAAQAAEAANAARFNQALSANAGLADAIATDDDLRQIDRRLAQLQKQREVADSIFSSFDQIGAFGENVDQTLTQGNAAQDIVKKLEVQFEEAAEAIETIKAKEEELRATIQDNVAVIDGDFVFGNENVIQKLLDQFIQANFSEEDQAAIQTLEQRLAPLEQSIASANEAVNEGLAARDTAIREFLDDIALGNVEFEGELGLIKDQLAELLNQDGVAEAVVIALRQIDDPTRFDAVIETLREGGVDPSTISQIIVDRKRNEIRQVTANLDAAKGAIDAETEELRIKILEQEAEFTKDVARAVAATTEAELLKLEADLNDVGAENADAIAEAFTGFAVELASGYGAAVDSAFAGTDFAALFEGNPAFADLVGGQVLIDAINGQIDASTTPEQAADIINAEAAKYSQIMSDFVNALIAAGIVTPDEEAAVRGTVASSVARIQAAFLSGLTGVQAAVDTARTAAVRRTAPKKGGGGGGGKSAEQLAKDALRDARKIEDAFRDAEKQILDAKESIVENAFGIDATTRAGALLGIDIAEIEQDFDNKLTRLKRRIEDIEIDFAGDPAKLAELKAQVQEAITLTEAAKEAEIQAANSFEAQMERRSDAIDLFIRDLETFAAQSDSTFAKVAAGIGVAFAEYTKDLVTLVDITSEAVTGFLDAATTGVADFIFDNENAWESFKETMLNISRQIFEGFTKSLLQQGISSLTDGGGSIFGNAVQPSTVGGAANGETPSVGGGGFLSRLLGGVFGGGQQGAPGAGGAGEAGQIQAGTTAIAQALQQGAVQIQAALQQVGIQTRQGGAQVSGGLNQAGQQTRQGGQQVGQAFVQAGQQIGTAAGQASASIAAGGAGGGGGLFGGGGGFLSGILGTALSFFAEGGQANNAGLTNRQIRTFAGAMSTGGKIQGAGTGTSDDILAFLSNGEFVVKADVTKEFLPVLEALNSGNTSAAIVRLLQSANSNSRPRSRVAFATGGLVGDTSFGAPSVNLTEPRTVLIDKGSTGANLISNTNNTRQGDTIVNVSMTYVNKGSDDRSARRSADQMAKRIGQQIERSKKNT